MGVEKAGLFAELGFVHGRAHMAVCSCYSYNAHEKRIGEIAKEMGFTHVSLSSEVMPMVRIVPRGYTGTMIVFLLTIAFNVPA